jgi:hypothetical protein
VDARNVRNIVLMRPVNSMIEFKQIIGRGTRLFDGKAYFTIIDFVEAYKHFNDPEWDGEPMEPEPPRPAPRGGPAPEPEPPAEPADFCFASPELMEEPEQVGPASGVYNLGMLGLFMLQPAAFNTSGLGMSQLLQWKRPPVPMNIDAEAARLLVSMLQKDRSMRPGGPDAIYVEIDRCCDRLEAAQATNTSVKIHEEVFEIRTESDIPVKETEAIPKKQEEKPIQTQIRDRQERQLPETETRVKTCIKPGCDTEMQASAVFCRICGTYQQPAGNRICPHCGAAVPAGLSYCNQCERVLNA